MATSSELQVKKTDRRGDYSSNAETAGAKNKVPRTFDWAAMRTEGGCEGRRKQGHDKTSDKAGQTGRKRHLKEGQPERKGDGDGSLQREPGLGG